MEKVTGVIAVENELIVQALSACAGSKI